MRLQTTNSDNKLCTGTDSMEMLDISFIYLNRKKKHLMSFSFEEQKMRKFHNAFTHSHTHLHTHNYILYKYINHCNNNHNNNINRVNLIIVIQGEILDLYFEKGWGGVERNCF